MSWYQFQRIDKGTDKGAFFHPYFLRGRPDLIMLMVRRDRPKPSSSSRNCRRKRSPRLKPDLDAFPNCRKLEESPEVCQAVREALPCFSPGTSWSSNLPDLIERQKVSIDCQDTGKPPVLAFDEEHDLSESAPALGIGEDVPSSMDSDFWQPQRRFLFEGPVGLVGTYNEGKQTYDIDTAYH